MLAFKPKSSEKVSIGAEVNDFFQKHSDEVPGADFGFQGFKTIEHAKQASGIAASLSKTQVGQGLFGGPIGFEVAEPKCISIGSQSLYIPRVSRLNTKLFVRGIDVGFHKEFKRGWKQSIVEKANDD